MKNLHLKTLAVCFTLLVATSCSNDNKAEESTDSKEHAEDMNDNLDKDTEKDADRMMRIHMANLFEIQSSEQAVTKASTAEVKKLATMMVAAHTKMGAEMQTLATSKGITLPAEMTNEQKRDLDDLNEKTGIDYDKQYTDLMKNKHEDVIKDLEKINEKSEDAEIKQFATKGIPEIRSHHDMIVSTRESIKETKDEAKKDGKHADHDGHDHK
jgi:putative membrane protein